ncbi:MAG TPA: cytochrome c maturation protein CcmE, partial [Woeseiaceae bacterium]|nr:cytochrome c maturation protein CcmE [Woeseiaceae bacterium]
MKPRQQRLLAVGLAAAGLVIATALTLTAFQKNMMFYIEIEEVVQGNVPDLLDLDIEHHVFLKCLQRQRGGDDESGRRQADGQQALLSGFHFPL